MKHATISPSATIQNNVIIGTDVRIFGDVTIGPNCYIGDGVTIGYPDTREILKKVANSETDVEIEKLTLGRTIIGSGCTILDGTIIGENSKIGDGVFFDIRTRIGMSAIIGSNTVLLYGALVYNEVSIGRDCRISGFSCDRSVIGNNVSMFGELIHSYRMPKGGLIEPSPEIGSFSTIGWNAIVIGGVTVGEYSYVGAGAIIAKSIPHRHIVIGEKGESIPLSDWQGRLRENQILSNR